MVTQQGSHSERAVWLPWIAATALGCATGWVLGLALVVWLHSSWIVGGAVTGALIGVTQWFVLRRWFHRVGWWVLASAAIWSLGLELRAAVSWQIVSREAGGIGEVLGAAVGGLAGGTLVGIAHWFLLRRRVYQPGWCVLASALGWSLGWALGMAASDVMIGVVAGAIAGIVTGGTLQRLVQLRLPKNV